jgi:hypothetical protein
MNNVFTQTGDLTADLDKLANDIIIQNTTECIHDYKQFTQLILSKINELPLAGDNAEVCKQYIKGVCIAQIATAEIAKLYFMNELQN